MRENQDNSNKLWGYSSIGLMVLVFILGLFYTYDILINYNNTMISTEIVVQTEVESIEKSCKYSKQNCLSEIDLKIKKYIKDSKSQVVFKILKENVICRLKEQSIMKELSNIEIDKDLNLLKQVIKLSICYAEKGDYEQAINLVYNSNNPDALKFLANYYELQKNKIKAIETYEKLAIYWAKKVNIEVNFKKDINIIRLKNEPFPRYLEKVNLNNSRYKTYY